MAKHVGFSERDPLETTYSYNNYNTNDDDQDDNDEIEEEDDRDDHDDDNNDDDDALSERQEYPIVMIKVLSIPR